MSERSDFVSLEIDDQRIDTWTEYHCDSDILTPADAFSLKLELGGRGDGLRDDFARVRELCKPLKRVQLFVGADVHGGARSRALILTGRIDRQQISTSRGGGSTITVQGRDTAAYLVDSAAPVGLVRTLGDEVTFSSLARAAVAPWGIEVISESSTMREITTGLAALTSSQRLVRERAVREGIAAARMSSLVVHRAQATATPLTVATETQAELEAGVRREVVRRDRARRRSASGMTGSDVEQLTIDEASPHSGETVWAFLARHAERLGILMFMDPRGRLILGAPDYRSDPLYTFVHRFTSSAEQPNNVTSIDCDGNGADRFSRVKVFGRTHGRGTARSRVHAVIEDDSMEFRRERTEHDRSVRTTEHAQRIAKRLIREGLASAEVLTVHADDHGQGRYLYAPNTVANVVYEAGGIDGRRYVTSRTFTRSREHGTSTQLRLVPLDSLTL